MKISKRTVKKVFCLGPNTRRSTCILAARRLSRLRPGYYDPVRGCHVLPDCSDIDIIKRCNTYIRRKVRMYGIEGAWWNRHLAKDNGK